ncbi:MAG: hypothetical protein H7Y22_02870 [Gemmatimonadaceae bacterium]|nr:hypothetical protein [Gloeobacterales cyanobacterium ES-bin-141]
MLTSGSATGSRPIAASAASPRSAHITTLTGGSFRLPPANQCSTITEAQTMKLEPIDFEEYGGRHYSIGEQLLPSVTTVLAATRPAADTEALRQWAEQIGAEQAEAIRSAAEERGTRLHTLIERRLSGQVVEQLDAEQVAVLPWWSSVLPVLSRIQSVHFLEHTVHHPHFCYAGSLDLVASVGTGDGHPEEDERLVLIDWKSSGKAKQRAWLGDYPLQLAAYWHALQVNQPNSCTEGWIVVAHPLGTAQVHRFYRADLERAWFEWLARLEHFWSLFPQHPLSAQGRQAIREGKSRF